MVRHAPPLAFRALKPTAWAGRAPTPRPASDIFFEKLPQFLGGGK